MTAVTAYMTCRTEVRSSAKFCSECGAPASASTPTAEYKQVTVLFADVVHSVGIAAALGAERLREIMAGLPEPDNPISGPTTAGEFAP